MAFRGQLFIIKVLLRDYSGELGLVGCWYLVWTGNSVQSCGLLVDYYFLSKRWACKVEVTWLHEKVNKTIFRI